ncbi:MAG TPA: Crp/Fnr family transcriptional regulator [Bacteroidaceae bacterium]|nr:Crp/Fnr family transcriptional regulator [Bacteroidaceae bacterium]
MIPANCNCELCDLKNLFFTNLDSAQSNIVCSGKTEKEFATGELIIKEGTLIKDFIYLKSGLVKLYKTDSRQKEQIITIARPFYYVSLLSIFSDEVYNYSVTALEDSVTCQLVLDDIKKLIDENASLAKNLLREMSLVADRIIMESLEIKKKYLKGRVAHLLIYFADDIYQKDEFDLPLSRKEMADYVGMTTENVIRTLSEFRKDGILKIYGKTIMIVDKSILKSIAEYG